MSGRPLIGITVEREDGPYYRLRPAYASALVGAGGLPMLLPDVADPLDLSRSLDGLMVSGGADIDPSYYDEEPLQSTRCVPKERTDFEIALVRTIIELGKPVFGICYGMQLLNVAFGGALYQDLNTQFGVTVDHGRGEHMITGEGRHISGSFKVNSSHHQGVRELGKGLASCCYSADGLIEAITLPAYPFLLGVQWHPERSGDELSQGLFMSFVEKCRSSQ